MKWTCGSDFKGSTQLKSAYQYLRDQNYACQYIEGAVNLNTLYLNLRNGNPHIAAGQSGDGGHAFIYDGIRGTLNGTTFTNVLLHCNWGNSDFEGTEGGHSWANGWYANYTKPNGTGNYNSSKQHIYITENR